MNVSQLESLLVHLYDIGTDPANRRYLASLIWGESGIGKTQTVNHVAEILTQRLNADNQPGDPIETVISRPLLIGQLDVGDLLGLPREQAVYPDPVMAAHGATKLFPKRSLVAHMRITYPGQYDGMSNTEVFERTIRAAKEFEEFMGETRTVYSLPDWFPEPGTRGILFLDEINRSSTEVRQAIFQLLLGRTIHNVELPPDWIVVAAANPPTKDYEVELTYDKAFMARFLHIGLRPTPDEWLRYAAGRDIETSIRSLIAGDPDLLGNLNITIPDIKPTPRSWELLGNVLPDLPSDLVLEVAQGIVGRLAAKAWIRKKESPEQPLSAEDILKHYGNGRTVGPKNTMTWDGGLITNLGQDYSLEDGTRVSATPATGPRKRLSTYLKAHRNDLINATLKNLEEALRVREERTPPDGRPLTDDEAQRVTQFLLDLIQGAYRDLVLNYIKQRLANLSGNGSDAPGAVLDQLYDTPHFADAVLIMVGLLGIISEEEMAAIQSDIPDEFFNFDKDEEMGLLPYDGFDPHLLDRLIA